MRYRNHAIILWASRIGKQKRTAKRLLGSGDTARWRKDADVTRENIFVLLVSPRIDYADATILYFLRCPEAVGDNA